MKAIKYVLTYGSIEFYITGTSPISSMEYTLKQYIAQSNRFKPDLYEDVDLIQSSFDGDYPKVDHLVFDTTDDIEKYFKMYD